MKYIIFCIIVLSMFASCGDDDTRVLSPDNVFKSSTTAISSAASSASIAPDVSSAQSSSDAPPAYIAPDFLVATSSRLFRGYFQQGIPRIELFAENRHVVNTGCKYSIDSSGIIYNHATGTSWDSGIRANICHLGIYYYKYHDAIYVVTMQGDYRVPIGKPGVLVRERSRSWYIGEGYAQWAQIPRATDYSIIVGDRHYLHNGDQKQTYELTGLFYYPAFLHQGNPHESDLMWRLSGKTTHIKCGEYATSTTNTIKEADLKTDQIKIGATWYLGTGATMTASGYTAPTNKYRTCRKFALHDDGNYMYWYDSEEDKVVRNSIHAPETFVIVDGWQWNVTYPSSLDIDSKMSLRMNPMSIMRFDAGYWTYINNSGTLLVKNVLDGSTRVCMTNIPGALAVKITADRFHGERGF